MRRASRAAGRIAVTSAGRVRFPDLGLAEGALADDSAPMREKLAGIAAANPFTAADPALVRSQAERASPDATPRLLAGWG
jgi:hypothetical protein